MNTDLIGARVSFVALDLRTVEEARFLGVVRGACVAADLAMLIVQVDTGQLTLVRVDRATVVTP